MKFTVSKAFWKSKTVWGGVIAAIGGIFNLNIDPVVVNDIGQTVANTGFDSIGSIMTFVGSVLAIYGRFVATTTLVTTDTPTA